MTYEKLLKANRYTHTLLGISRLLEWDHETYMPSNAFVFRSEQLELLSSLIHKAKTARSFENLLTNFIDLKSGKIVAKKLSFEQKRVVQLLRRDFLKEKKLPTRFVERFTKLSSQAVNIWGRAKKEKNFALFAPFLTEIVAMSQEKIDYYGYKDHPYDALLDDYDPDRKTAEVEKLFSELGTFLPPLLKKIPKVSNDSILGDYEEHKQLKFSRLLLEKIGYDLTRGRLDISNHPFSMSMHPTDSRITTRLHKDNVMECISSVTHEAGHSFYEMGFNPDHFGTPLAEAVSLTLHESQSRFWQTFIGQSLPFWQFFYPLLQKEFKKPFEKLPLATFYQAINKVAPSPIRVEADEVTYSLHVIIRFELEKELLTSKLKVTDLPEAWNAKMKKYLGITPKDISQGCLQDIHWAMGAFGYFPTYTLGNLYAATLFETFTTTFPSWEKKMASGDFAFVLDWLRTHIHSHGRLYTGAELLTRITGQTLSTTPYCNYLKKKYL